jgi:membrane protein
LNTIWGVKAKPGRGIWGFLRNRFLSFTMVAGVCFLLLVSLILESLLKVFSQYIQSALPGGINIAVTIYLIFDFAVVVLLFAMIFKFLPDVKIQWRDVWIGAVMTAILFGIGKWLLGFYLGSGAAGSAYGAASSLITLLLWVYYSSQILLFGLNSPRSMPPELVVHLNRLSTQSGSKQRKSRAINETRKRTSKVGNVAG